MDFLTFDATARKLFASIPPEFREGVDGLEVERSTVTHPTLPGVFTLGECRSDFYPTEFGGAGEVRSVVVLFYGSFLESSRTDEPWDWEEEIFETITHEIRHHLESLASDVTLEEMDYAEDQNFARREGEPFDPEFYRAGRPVTDEAWEVDGDIFVEVRPTAAELGDGQASVRWDGEVFRVPLGRPQWAVEFVPLRVDEKSGAELIAVVLPRLGPLQWIRALFQPPPARVRDPAGPSGRPDAGREPGRNGL